MAAMPELIPDYDLYAELEVGEAATTAVIESAWRALMRRNHPDVGPAGSIHRSVRLNVAHDWLTDPARRARYDEDRAAIRRRRDAAQRQRDAERPQGRATSRRRAGRGPVPGARGPEPKRDGRGGHRRAAVPRPRRAAIRMAHPLRPGRDWRHTARRALATVAIVAALVTVGVVRMLVGSDAVRQTVLVVGGVPPTAEIPSTPAPSTPSPAPSPSSRPTPVPSPPPTPVPSPTVPPPSPVATTPGSSAAPSTTAAASISGSGNRDGIAMTLASGTYTIAYVVTAPTGTACAWVLWLTDASGFPSLAASAYPLPGDTVRDSETAANVVAGAATARVQSDCQSWQFTLTHAAP